MNKSSKLLKRIWDPSRTVVRHHPYPTYYRQFLQNSCPRTQFSKLCNGFTIVTEERPEMRHACIGLYVDGGTRYESERENGIVHFFEHLVFKSTRTRNKDELLRVMSSIGANFRCFTSREMIGFYVQTLMESVPLAVDVLCDCVFNNNLEASDIEMQRTIVYGEMLKHEEDTNAVLYDYLHKAAFQGTPLAQTVMGPSYNLCNFNANMIWSYLKRFFQPTKMVLAAVGGVKHEQILDLANCYLCHSSSAKCIENDPYRFTGSEIRYRNDSMPVANVVIAVEAPSWHHSHHVVMEIARCAAGSWDRSQLFGNVLPGGLARCASEHHLCDAYKSFYITYKDTGLWGAQFISDVKNVDNMSNMIQGEWMYLCTSITEAEIDRAKRFLKTKLLSDMQSATKICHDLARSTLYTGYRPTLLDRITEIESVYAKDVWEVCSQYIYNKCPAVAAIGRTEGLFEYQRTRSYMYWLRL